MRGAGVIRPSFFSFLYRSLLSLLLFPVAEPQQCTTKGSALSRFYQSHECHLPRPLLLHFHQQLPYPLRTPVAY